MHLRQLPQCGVAGVGRQRQVGIDLAQEEPGSGLPAEHDGVLADPAQAGLFGQRFFHDRRRVGKHPVSEWSDDLFDPLPELLEPLADQLVVVAPERVA